MLGAAAWVTFGAVAAACVRPSGSGGPGTTTTAVTASATAGAAPTATSVPAGSQPPARTLRQKVARLLVLGFRGMTVEEAPWLAPAIVEDGLGGVILFDKDRGAGPRNIESPEQVRTLVGDLRALAPHRELIVAIDQEGGIVTRLSPRYGFPALASQAAIGGKPEAEVRAWAEGLAATLAEVGVNLNLAPVVDLDVNPDNPAIGAIDRAFSADLDVVTTDAAIAVEAHRSRGIRTALKHFPGLGSATTNTDFGVADVTDTWSDVELAPYRRLLALGLVDVVMAGHLVNGQLDASAPASLSRATVTGVLREQLGWDGVVITDDLQAAAITDAFGFEDAVALALDAGNDLLLFANQQAYQPGLVGQVTKVVERLLDQGRLAESRLDESIARLDALFPPLAR